MLSQIGACSLPLLYKLSVALPAGNQMHPKKDKTILRIDCGFLLVVISNKVLIVGIDDSMCSSSDVSSRNLDGHLWSVGEKFHGLSCFLKYYIMKHPFPVTTFLCQ